MHANLKQKKSLFSFWVPHLSLGVRGLQALFGGNENLFLCHNKIKNWLEELSDTIAVSSAHELIQHLLFSMVGGFYLDQEHLPNWSHCLLKGTLKLNESLSNQKCCCVVAMISLLLPVPLGDLVVVSKMEKQNSWECFCNVTFMFLAWLGS